ncbi:hypothetical protein BG60_23455 [Caballeronia zhejiangensis]|uniref:Uncharacterized protein n=1 Tax=Caballeronia zhejiangensis TaxID=871203 RepID=A0A656QF65_9BURK|nr:hypothetical protein BG60_23455 [Caballeronia zhejiangensis]
MVAAALRDFVLRADVFAAVVIFSEPFVAAFLAPAAFFDATAFLVPIFLLAARTFDTACEVLDLRVGDAFDVAVGAS